MRKNPETILLAKVRRQIREAIASDKVYSSTYSGWTSHYHTSRSLRAKRVKWKDVGDRKLPYFSKQSLSIEQIAKRIVKIVRQRRRPARRWSIRKLKRKGGKW